MSDLNILMAHNRYLISGGEDQSHTTEIRMLRDHGVHVDEYYKDNRAISKIGLTQAALQTIWSQSGYNEVRSILRAKKYDFLLVQNFFPLISPSIYYAASDENVPVIQFLRNYRLLCPNAYLFRENKVCEDCVRKQFPYPSIIHRCYRNSVSGSSVIALMLYIHRMIGTWTKKVDCYVALANFAKQKFVVGGLPSEKIEVRPNFIHPDPGIGPGDGNYAVFVGRISPEKGLNVLLDAWQFIEDKLPLKIIGEGSPLCDVKGVEWLGRKDINEVYSIIGRASLLVFPSIWYEGFGRTIIEAYSKGTPVIASRMGTMSELVINGVTGYHFEPGDVKDLVHKVEMMISDPGALMQFRAMARLEYESKYTDDASFQNIINIFEKIRKQKTNV